MRARTLKYAILGLLNQKNMSGYDLMQEFEFTLNEFWHAKHSQIYPELKKLTEEKMIEYKIEISGTVLEKKVYSITEEGRKDFLKWLGTMEEMEETPKDVFRLRTFYINCLEQEERVRFLEDGLAQHKERLRHLKENQKKFEQIPDCNSDEFGDYLVLMGAVMREEMTCNWISECLRLVRD